MEQTPIRPSSHRLRVVGVRDLTPSIRRVSLHAPTLTDLPLRPAQDVGLVLVDDQGRQARRRYTIRNVDPAAATIDLDGILHGHGPGARWFAGARIDDEVDVVGPRGKIELAAADWHLFVGDESGLPAFAELLAVLPDEATALALIEIPDATEEVALPGGPSTRIRWVHRDGRPAGGSELLGAAIEAADLPAGVGQAYLLGESRSVVVLRRVLGGRGLVGAQVFLKGYWNTAHR